MSHGQKLQPAAHYLGDHSKSHVQKRATAARDWQLEMQGMTADSKRKRKGPGSDSRSMRLEAVELSVQGSKLARRRQHRRKGDLHLIEGSGDCMPSCHWGAGRAQLPFDASMQLSVDRQQMD